MKYIHSEKPMHYKAMIGPHYGIDGTSAMKEHFVFTNNQNSVFRPDVYKQKMNRKRIQQKELKPIKCDGIRLNPSHNAAQRIVSESLLSNEMLLHMEKLKNYDADTYMHSIQVAVLSVKIGIAMNMDCRDLNSLAKAALLHDIGKTEISLSILNKTAALTDKEMKKMKTHAMRGSMYLNEFGDMNSDIIMAVQSHHENEDGSGYPFHLKKSEINVLAKIIHVCDVYHALVSRRSYKPAMSKAEASDFIKNQSDKMFDAHIVSILLSNV